MPKITPDSIIKLFRKLRDCIRLRYHKKWNNEQMGLEPDITGVSRLEIEESPIIGNANNVLWMFGIIDRVDKNARVWCVMDDRLKQKLLPYVKNNVYTPPNNNDNEFKTQIYSDCYSVYRQEDFSTMGFVLHRVNHSVWFGQRYVSYLFNRRALKLYKKDFK